MFQGSLPLGTRPVLTACPAEYCPASGRDLTALRRHGTALGQRPQTLRGKRSHCLRGKGTPLLTPRFVFFFKGFRTFLLHSISLTSF